MVIKIYPEELVKLCLWDNYSYYVVGSEKEAEEILKENNEFEISERDALVIGLLKIIETPNLIHKFNTYLTEFLTNKSITNDGNLKIRKKSVLNAISKFRNKFPQYWEPQSHYQAGLNDLNEYMDGVVSSVEELVIEELTDQFGTHEFLLSKDVKKILSFNY